MENEVIQKVAHDTPNNEGQSTPSDKQSMFSLSSAPTPVETCESNEEEFTLTNKRPLRSVVWAHFKRQKVNGVWKAICNYCLKQLGGSSNDGTSHLQNHFKRCPLRKTQDIKQSILKHSVNGDGKTTIASFVFNEEVARQKLAAMIIAHEYPMNMVEHYAFREFIQALQPLFKVKSRTTVKNDVMKIYQNEKSKTMKMFESNTSRVAITTDMWTASNQDKGYMAITTHFIDDAWTLQSRIVRFAYVPCPHTAEVLCDVLVDCLMDWNLDGKLSTLTLDNCSTNDALIHMVLSKLPVSNFLLNGALLHMRCCAHILNLIVKDGMDIIRDAIQKVRDSVSYWTATPKRYEKFEETVRQLKISYTKKLALDCKTRWNSTYLMLNVAISYKDAFKRLSLREALYNSCPSHEEWEAAKQICDRLEVFDIVTELFSGTKYPTSNLYFPKICEIKMALAEWLKCEQIYIQLMASKMMEKFDKYWSHIHGIMGVAIILDPRYKLMPLEYYFPIIYGEEMAKCEIDRIQNICYDLLVEYAPRLKAGQSNYSFSQASGSSSSLSSKHKENLSKFEKFVESRSVCHKEQDVKGELDLYLKNGVIQKNADFDILQWWKNAFMYPTLQLMAKDILAIPVSTVASESAFSTGGRFITPHRSRLSSELVEAFVCTQNWQWKNLKDTSTSRPHFHSFFEEIGDEDIEEDLESTINDTNTVEVEDLN